MRPAAHKCGAGPMRPAARKCGAGTLPAAAARVSSTSSACSRDSCCSMHREAAAADRRQRSAACLQPAGCSTHHALTALADCRFQGHTCICKSSPGAPAQFCNVIHLPSHHDPAIIFVVVLSNLDSAALAFICPSPSAKDCVNEFSKTGMAPSAFIQMQQMLKKRGIRHLSVDCLSAQLTPADDKPAIIC